jgi:hypothetical protein
MKSIKDITNTYNYIKKLVKHKVKHDQFERALMHIEAAASIAYNFNFIFFDLELENTLSLISEKIIIKQDYVPFENRIVFFDSFVLDNRGLTQQYLRALIYQNKDILFIHEGDSVSNSKLIIQELQNYNKCDFFQVDKNLSRLNKINLIYKKIFDYKPKQILIHTTPTNVIAPVVFSALNSATRYMINLTDHAFWLGTCCIDYCLEFRDYGYTISLQKRNIPQEKLLYQPYYPITETNEYQGLPINLNNNHKIILTGGAFYKMYGENNTFFNILKELINLDDQVLILVVGDGYKAPLLNFINKFNLNNKIILLGNRNDLNHLFIKSDIYLCTFPISGGLMTQLAAKHRNPILSYSTDKYRFNDVNPIKGKSSILTKTFYDLSELLSEAKKMIHSKLYREHCANNAFNSIITIEEFNLLFSDNIKKPESYSNFYLIKINYSAIIDLYLNVENLFHRQFNFLLISKYKYYFIVYFPLLSLKTIFSKNFYIIFFNKFLKYKHE